MRDASRSAAKPQESGRPRLLDLFCGAGGAAMGYHRAGFDVVGVDIAPQPRYPFEFHQADALMALGQMQINMTPKLWGVAFDAIHASPPCQRYSPLAKLHKDIEYPDLIAPTRTLLEQTALPWVIENVPGAPLRHPFKLCGSSFGLDVRRHRLFETNWPIGLLPPCAHHLHTPRFQNTGKRRRAVLSSVVGVYGGSHFKGDNLKYRSDAMGIDWMQMDELSEAIPPAYTEFIGEQLLAHVRQGVAA